MNARFSPFTILACVLCLAGAGCTRIPGKPGIGSVALRPDQTLDFAVLYKQNCAACHGENGRNGAAISLANPVYPATAGIANIQRVTAAGISGTLMPPFGKAAGGLLTDRQIEVLAQGIVKNWGRPGALGSVTPLPYAGSSPGNPLQGQKAFALFCARCHGLDGSGGNANAGGQRGSLVDPAYLALISDQGLRSLIIAGQPQGGMPDWRSDFAAPNSRAMTDQEVTDTVAWLAAHRIADPGQPYRQQQAISEAGSGDHHD